MKKKFVFLGLIVISCLFAIILPFLQRSIATNDINSLITNSDNSQIEQIARRYNLQELPKKDARFLVISDLNGAYGSTEYDEEVKLAVKMLPFWQPDLVLCSGDMVAGQKRSLTIEQIKAMWQSFDVNIAKPIRDLNIPYGFTIGNHDASSALTSDKTKYIFQQERDLAIEYWQDPDHDPQINFIDGQDFPFYYTFKQNDIFFLVWDGSSSYIPPEKLAWVEKSLNSPEAQNAKMKMVMGHLPLYAVSKGRDRVGEVLNNANQLRQLLEKYNVQTYISGHHHAYYPANKGELQLLNIGALGGGARALLGASTPKMKTITIIDVDFDDPELTQYTTYNTKDLTIVNQKILPRLIIGHNGMLLRQDVELGDLTPNEKRACLDKYKEKSAC